MNRNETSLPLPPPPPPPTTPPPPLPTQQPPSSIPRRSLVRITRASFSFRRFSSSDSPWEFPFANVASIFRFAAAVAKSAESAIRAIVAALSVVAGVTKASHCAAFVVGRRLAGRRATAAALFSSMDSFGELSPQLRLGPFADSCAGRICCCLLIYEFPVIQDVLKTKER